MLDIKLIREKPDFVRENLARRGDPEYLRMLDELIECDKLWRQNLTRLNELRQKRNQITAEIALAKRKGENVAPIIAEAKAVDEEITRMEKLVADLEEKVRDYLMLLPNLLHESVPIGKDENDNVVVKTWGEPPKFSFPPKDHIELGLSLDIMDIERAGKVAGPGSFT
jgi:Seryl-tRNA synthetase